MLSLQMSQMLDCHFQNIGLFHFAMTITIFLHDFQEKGLQFRQAGIHPGSSPFFHDRLRTFPAFVRRRRRSRRNLFRVHFVLSCQEFNFRIISVCGETAVYIPCIYICTRAYIFMRVHALPFREQVRCQCEQPVVAVHGFFFFFFL